MSALSEDAHRRCDCRRRRMCPVGKRDSRDRYNIPRLLPSHDDRDSELAEALNAAGLGHVQPALAHLQVTTITDLIGTDLARLAVVW